MTGLGQHPVTDLDDQPAFFQYIDKQRRRLCALLRVHPAQQGFGADDLPAAGIHLGLEIQLELAAGQGQAQVVLQAQAGAGGFLHVAAEHLHGVAPGGFGAVQGDVGALEHVGRGVAVIGDQGHADAGRDLQAMAFQGHRCGQ